MGHPADLPKFQEVCDRLDRRREKVLGELHPDLRARVGRILKDPRFAPWDGYRTDREQADAYARGTSKAAPGESPHNFLPSYACDLVLDPRHVRVKAHKTDPRYPDLWDNDSPEAQAAWQALDEMAAAAGLRRVKFKRRGFRDEEPTTDLPHVELHGWRDMAGER